MRYAQIVMGPAGSGKSTYCSTILKHCENVGRSVHVVNLDPAAEYMNYTPSIDIRELITLDDAMAEMAYGPNGGLVFCLEFLANNMEWFEEQLDSYEEDYLLFDLPGQIELYTHFTVMRIIVDHLRKWDYSLCAVYMIDGQFVEDVPKFFAGSVSALSTMLQLEVPHINVLTKMDLFGRNPRKLAKFLDSDAATLLAGLKTTTPPKFRGLNDALANLLTEYNLVNYLPLNIHDEESVEFVLSHVDYAMQYGESEEPKEPRDMTEQEDNVNSALETLSEMMGSAGSSIS